MFDCSCTICSLLVLFQSVGLISCPFQDLITKMLWSEKESTSAWSQKHYENIVMSIICMKVLKYASDQPPPHKIKMEYIRGAAKAGLNVEAGITRASSISPLSLWTAFQWWPRSKWNLTHIWFLCHHLGLESVFWSFLTETKQDQLPPSHVHGKI